MTARPFRANLSPMAEAAAENPPGTPGRGRGNLKPPFEPGKSGNPGGRPKGLARTVRELVGGDGLVLAQIMTSIATDEKETTRDRIEATKWLADRGWGKAPAYAPIEPGDDVDPLDLSNEEARLIAVDFDRKIDEVAERRKRNEKKPAAAAGDDAPPPAAKPRGRRRGRTRGD